MQNFREKYAYRVSLFLFLLVPVMYYGMFLFQKGNFSNVTFFYLLSIPLVFFLSLLFRLFSLDPFKRWWDIFFTVLSFFFESSLVFAIIFSLISIILAVTFLISDYKRNKIEVNSL